MLDHNTPSASITVYVNHGGIGFSVGRDGQIQIPTEQQHQPLRLVSSLDGELIAAVEAPACGWDTDALSQALRVRHHDIERCAPVDAHLGGEWIGSTEV
ncbi:hypothetical protein EIP75_21410 [Aquabacterium soli]|uniref:Uncharacterized protein n=1 Tax=Aquabacterium soli TaxID=2493092 RepID=A0A3R8SYV5_9BURK|nr:hypothetical protein [Aquabacterium soli]RRS01139.1 hypothetical protein EIP75_21410 [Aquabacterium soli]